MHGLGRFLSVGTLALVLAACDFLDRAWDDPLAAVLGSGEKKVKLKGERIPVLIAEQQLKPDPAIQDLDVALPEAAANPDWPEPGGNPSHAMQQLALAGSLKEAWRASIGEGKSTEAKHLAAPVVGGGRVYTMDSDSIVRAFNTETGARQWEIDLKSDDVGKGDLGGGLAYADGQLFATSKYGELIALDAMSGASAWRRALDGPTRAAPTVGGGRVFVVTVDNQLHAVDAKTGQVLWTHAGLSEVTGLVGAASPAYDGGIVVVPYSSGELYALRADNGRVLWSDTLATIRRADSVSGLADIRGNPVIDHDRVVAVGHSGRMVSIDLRSGGRAWEDPIGGITQPWVAGSFIYVLSTDNQIICLTRDDGRVRWLTQLDRWRDPGKKKNLILWVGPILAGDRLLIAGTNEQLLALSPHTGEITDTVDIGDPVSVPPIVANGTLYILTDAGDLKAYR